MLSSTSNGSPMTGGRALSPNCLQISMPASSPVRLQTPPGSSGSCTDRFDLLVGGGEAYLTSQSRSSVNTVTTVQHEDTLISSLTDAQSPQGTSYIASNIGVSSECSVVDYKCQVNTDNLTYDCSKLSIAGSFTRLLNTTYATNQYWSTDRIYWNATISLKMNGFKLISNLIPGEAYLTRDNRTLLRILGCSSLVYNVRFSRSMVSPSYRRPHSPTSQSPSCSSAPCFPA